MRLLALATAFLGLLPLTVLLPFVGLLLWGWFTLMQPHRLLWGFPDAFEPNLILAGVTICAWLVSREPKAPPPSAFLVLCLLLSLHLLVVQIFSERPDYSWPYFRGFLSVMVFTLLCLTLMGSRVRIHAMALILCVSIGYYAVLGGLGTLLTGGRYLLFGPPDTIIADNNHLALALVTTIPILEYARRQSERASVRLVFGAVMVLGVVAVVGTYSRGALLALAAMGVVMWLHARRKLVGLVLGGFALLAIWTSTTEAWRERAATIANYAEEPSFVGRRDAWVIAYEVALGRPLLGLGLRVPYLQEEVNPYLSTPRTARAAHSIYFELLGSAGFVGLGLFLGILASAWHATGRILRLARDRPEHGWAADLARAARASLAGFAVGGAALSMEFWDGFWLIAALVTATQGRLAVEQAILADRTAPFAETLEPVSARARRC